MALCPPALGGGGGARDSFFLCPGNAMHGSVAGEMAQFIRGDWNQLVK